MRTRSQSRNSNRQQQQVNSTFVEPFNLVEPIKNQAPPVVTMADNRTMAQLLEAPTVGYEDAIVVPEITGGLTFELKQGFAYLVPKINNLGHDHRRHHAHIVYSTKITSTMKFNELSGMHTLGFLELHQLDTFYNALNSNDQDSLNFAAGGNFLDKMPCDCLRIIESKSKVRNSRNKPVVAKVSASSSTPGISPDVAELKDMVKALLLDKKNQSQTPAPVKAVEESCVTCGGAHSYRNCPATDGNVYRDNIQEYVSQAAATNFNQGNTGYRAPIANQIRPPALADLGASINLMPLSVWKNLSLPELTPTCMTLELADRSISQQIGIAEDVDVKVGKFQFPAGFVVGGKKLTLRVGKEAVTFNLDQTLRYSSNYDDNSVNRIDVIEMACEEYSQESSQFFFSEMNRNWQSYSLLCT
ncbi:reverse transcriptase domain-containing protein [Tanacetum coccineum]